MVENLLLTLIDVASGRAISERGHTFGAGCLRADVARQYQLGEVG